MKENLDLSPQQIETISFSIYKEITPYIQKNINEFVFWLLDFRVVSLDGIIEIDCLYEYDLCKNQRRKIL